MSGHYHDPKLSGEIIMNDVELTAGAAELNRKADVSGRLVAAGATLTVTEALHEGRIVTLPLAGGVDITLPAAVGSGAVYKFLVTTAPSGDTHTISVAAGTDDEFLGAILAVQDDDDILAWQAAAADDFDRITVNGTTQGGLPGDFIEVTDMAAGVWAVTGQVVQANASAATPFSDASITS